jgi:hypothetical protein
MLASTAFPLAITRDVECLLREALALGMEEEYHIEQDLGRDHDRQVLGLSLSVWPGDLVCDVLRWQFASHLTSVSWHDSCLFHFHGLIANTSVSILRERECWLSDRPEVISVNDGIIGAHKAAAVVYGDGTQLHVHQGRLMPKAFVLAPQDIPLDDIDSDTAQPIRRTQIIALLGVENYLAARKAVVEANIETATLWKVDAGKLGTIRMLQLYDEDRLSGPGVTYYELPPDVSTLDAAMAFAAEPDDVIRLVIDA